MVGYRTGKKKETKEKRGEEARDKLWIPEWIHPSATVPRSGWDCRTGLVICL
jgi:hypothetical protein